jgi:hypothetical protein
VVVIAQSPGYWLDDGLEVLSSQEGDKPNQTREEALLKGISRTVSDVQAAGHQVVLVVPLLQLVDIADGPMPANCTTLMLLKNRCFETVPIEEVLDQQAAILRLEKSLEGLPVVKLVLSGEQCPSELCGLWVGDIPIYADNSHASAEFSELSTPFFVDALRRAEQKQSD